MGEQNKGDNMRFGWGERWFLLYFSFYLFCFFYKNVFITSSGKNLSLVFLLDLW